MSNNRLDSSKEAKLSELNQRKLKRKAELKVLTCSIEEINQELIQIEAEHAAIQNTRVALLALPTEVTCLIFQFALGYHVPRHSEPFFEITASHVCSQWRTISLAYPRLWRRVCYVGPKIFLRDLDRLDAYLQRSVPQGLELWLDFRKTHIDDEEALLEKTLEHVERWKFFSVFAAEEDSLAHLLHEIEHVCAPNLEHFAFSCEVLGFPRSYDLVKNLDPTIFTNGAPKLQSVILDCSSVACLPSLSNITTLRLEIPHAGTVFAFPWSTFQHILALPWLENLSLFGHIFYSPEPSSTGQITMTKLKHLRSEYGGMPQLLPRLRAPLLQTITIQNHNFLDCAGASSEPYVFPSLKSVTLINITVDTSSGEWYFAQMTESATEILISEEASSLAIFSLLQNSEELLKIFYWSKVKVLTCNFEIMEADDHGAFLQFAKSRCKNDLVVRIFDRLDRQWRRDFSPEYDVFTEACNIEIMDVEDNPFSQLWPPGEHSFEHFHDNEDPFDIKPY
ncbi:hypothetical protein GALMADRAFT_255616 [Galerina marginata CBS 339.88]|uniref:Uncharacterized protein n=1 Tax=Galerina marginata (strain CBS 339.88) TaxID=685588 RepID=A0A067SSP2_GALM3|nr:hypothetical protein GALMADRAFT_255616 [Galerina marginata CBS 339.88]